MKEYEVEVRWLAFPLHPDTPDEGMSLEALFAGRRVDVAAIQQRLARMAESLSLPLAPPTKTYNSRRAQELAKWAESQGKGEEFHHAVFRACFVESRNIAMVDELAAVAASLGLAPDEARRVMEERAFRGAVEADWQRSRVLGISAVPTFMSGAQRVVGFQPYEVLAQLVTDAGARRRT